MGILRVSAQQSHLSRAELWCKRKRLTQPYTAFGLTEAGSFALAIGGRTARIFTVA